MFSRETQLTKFEKNVITSFKAKYLHYEGWVGDEFLDLLCDLTD